MAEEQRLNGNADIASVLTSHGLLSGAALERVRRLEAQSGERIDLIAAKLGLIPDRQLAEAYASLLGTPLLSREGNSRPSRRSLGGTLSEAVLRYCPSGCYRRYLDAR